MQNGARKILIVDDDQMIRHLIELGLRKQGFEVRAAQNGRVALGLLSAFTPDLIISDVVMPIMNGYDFCTAVRKDIGKHYRKIPFIFLTAKTGARAAAEGFRHGADLYLTKPFSQAELINHVYSLIDKINLKESVNSTFAARFGQYLPPGTIDIHKQC